GERSVILRRVGNIQDVMVAYHIPAALHPDAASLQVAAQILGSPQTGRLYKELVDSKKAVSVFMYANHMHDPGFSIASARIRLRRKKSTVPRAASSKILSSHSPTRRPSRSCSVATTATATGVSSFSIAI